MPVATTWTTHVLNTEVRDPSILVSISSDQFTPTVNGWVEWEIRSYTISSFGSRLQNITDGTTAGMGMLGNGNNGPSSGATSTGGAPVVASKAFAIQYYASTAPANGLGLALSQGTEVYARVKFWRTKYARIIDGVVDSTSYDLPYFEGGPEPGWTEVPTMFSPAFHSTVRVSPAQCQRRLVRQF